MSRDRLSRIELREYTKELIAKDRARIRASIVQDNIIKNRGFSTLRDVDSGVYTISEPIEVSPMKLNDTRVIYKMNETGCNAIDARKMVLKELWTRQINSATDVQDLAKVMKSMVANIRLV